jgi:hypothetical protein
MEAANASKRGNLKASSRGPPVCIESRAGFGPNDIEIRPANHKLAFIMAPSRSASPMPSIARAFPDGPHVSASGVPAAAWRSAFTYFKASTVIWELLMVTLPSSPWTDVRNARRMVCNVTLLSKAGCQRQAARVGRGFF